MPKRIIRVVYFTTLDGMVHNRGEEVDLSQEDCDRGDSLGAFRDNPIAPGAEGMVQSSLVEPLTPERPDTLPTVATELTPDEIDSLTGTQLDDACSQEGLDTTTGGQLAGGKWTADEKRAALKAS